MSNDCKKYYPRNWGEIEKGLNELLLPFAQKYGLTFYDINCYGTFMPGKLSLVGYGIFKHFSNYEITK